MLNLIEVLQRKYKVILTVITYLHGSDLMW